MEKIEYIIQRLASLKKYDYNVRGCECCGEWVEFTEDKQGDYIKSEEVEKLIEELKTLTEN